MLFYEVHFLQVTPNLSIASTILLPQLIIICSDYFISCTIKQYIQIAFPKLFTHEFKIFILSRNKMYYKEDAEQRDVGT